MNCTFNHNKQHGLYPTGLVHIDIYSKQTPAITIVNCTFNANIYIEPLIKISSMVAVNASLVNITFNHNRYCGMIYCTCHLETTKALILLSGIFINGTRSTGTSKYLILFQTTTFIHIKGNIIISNNRASNVISIDNSNVTLSGNVTFYNNYCLNVIELWPLISYISILEHSTILFQSNFCSKELLTDKSGYMLYPYCPFQYFTLTVNITALENQNKLQLFSIKFIANYQQHMTLNYYLSNCRWLEGTTFYGYDAREVNKNIIQTHNDSNKLLLNQHFNLCYCPRDHMYDCSTDMLGCVYPGQTLQAELCTPFKKEPGFTIMYVETQNIAIQNVTCKIAHEAELTAKVGKKHTEINLTIVSNKTDRCSLFLVAQLTTYKHYDVFQVMLLPCPVGFTLLNGICNCDPYLVNSDLQINTCYINELAITHPANSWINYRNQSNETHYSISPTCPMDYCSPSTTKLNLEHPDSQCQFHRTGMASCVHSVKMDVV